MRRCAVLAGLFLGLGAGVDGQDQGGARNADTAVARALAYLKTSQLPDGSWPSTTTLEQGLDNEMVIKHSSDRAVRAFISSFCGLAFLAQGSTPSRGEFARELARSRDYVIGYARIRRTCMANPTWVFALCAVFLSEIHRKEPSEELRRTVEDLAAALDEVREESGFWGHGRMGRFDEMKTYRELTAAHNWAVVALARAKGAGVGVPAALLSRGLAFYDEAVRPSGAVPYTVGEVRLPDRFPEDAKRAMKSGEDGQAPGRTAGAALALDVAGRTSKAYEKVVRYARAHLASTPTSHTPLLHLLEAAWLCRRLGAGDWRKFADLFVDRLLKLQQKDGSVADWAQAYGDGADAESHNLGAPYRTAVAAIILQLPRGHVDGGAKPAPARPDVPTGK